MPKIGFCSAEPVCVLTQNNFISCLIVKITEKKIHDSIFNLFSIFIIDTWLGYFKFSNIYIYYICVYIYIYILLILSFHASTN